MDDKLIVGQREAIARIVDPTAWKLDSDGYWVEQVHSGEALAKADAILALERDHRPAAVGGGVVGGEWSYDFSPRKLPNNLVEVAFDAGLGFSHVEICRRVITKSMATYDVPLPVDQYEYGFVDQYEKPVYPDRRAYAWREIQLPPRQPVAIDAPTTPTPVSAAVEERAREDDQMTAPEMAVSQALQKLFPEWEADQRDCIAITLPPAALTNAQPIRAGVREALLEREACAQLADRWCAENKAAAAKARKRAGLLGDDDMPDMLDGAAVECNAIAQAIRARPALATPDAALTERAGDLTTRVRRLVIAARVFWDLHDSEMDETARDLDRALEAFASEIPYEDQPDAA